MRHIFSLYPGGAAGAGLVLLRLHAVLLLADLAVRQSPVLAGGICLLAAAVALGMYARVATPASTAVLGAALLTGTHLAAMPMMSQFCSLVALVLLGPGALSVDAYRFGRKVIHLS